MPLDSRPTAETAPRFGSDKAAGALVLGALAALVALHTYFRTVIGG